MLERYGGPAVFLGRFVAFARAVIPGLAGMSGLRYRVFLFYNAIGGLIWGVGYTLLGYIVGVSFEHILSTVGEWSIAVVGGVVVIAVVVGVVVKRRERSRTSAGAGAPTGAAGPVRAGEPPPGPPEGERTAAGTTPNDGRPLPECGS